MWWWRDELPKPKMKFDSVWLAQKKTGCYGTYIETESKNGPMIEYINYKGTNVFTLDPRTKRVYLHSNTDDTMSIVKEHCRWSYRYVTTNGRQLRKLDDRAFADWLAKETGKTPDMWYEWLTKERKIEE